MALQFANFASLKTDLESQPGIEAVGTLAESATGSVWGTYDYYDLVILKKMVDPDGTTRFVNATQQIIHNTATGNYGYGSNRQWDLEDRSVDSFGDRLVTEANSFVGTSPPGVTGTIVSVSFEPDMVNSNLGTAIVLAYDDTGASYRAAFRETTPGTFDKQIIS